MNQQRDFWNLYYASGKENSDPWLNAYNKYFAGAQKILDLGCGNGSNIPFLVETGAEVLAVDISENAIEYILSRWKVSAIVHDMKKRLPFPCDSFDVVLADLSLHYFSIDQTTKIITDIHRIMKENGRLIGRVNSVNDTNHGAGKGLLIEPNFYDDSGRTKRFFDRDMLDFFFNNEFHLAKACENESDKYDLPKQVWEFVAVK